MTGKDICIFIEKHHLEEVDEIILDDDTINFNITFESGDWLMYSLFDFGNGAQGDVVFWPGPNNWLEMSSKKISFEDAMKMREAGKVTDEYLANYIYKEEEEHNKQLKSKNSGRYPWDKIEKEGYCSVCAIEKGSPTCEKCNHKEE